MHDYLIIGGSNEVSTLVKISKSNFDNIQHIVDELMNDSEYYEYDWENVDFDGPFFATYIDKNDYDILIRNEVLNDDMTKVITL